MYSNTCFAVYTTVSSIAWLITTLAMKGSRQMRWKTAFLETFSNFWVTTITCRERVCFALHYNSTTTIAIIHSPKQAIYHPSTSTPPAHYPYYQIQCPKNYRSAAMCVQLLQCILMNSSRGCCGSVDKEGSHCSSCCWTRDRARTCIAMETLQGKRDNFGIYTSV